MKKILLPLLLFVSACTGMSTQDQLAYFEKETGLKEVPVPKQDGVYLGKNHNGYEILFTTEMGNVWGRWAARVTMGEVLAFLSDGHYRPNIAGSQLDRLLSRVIGQPLTIIVIAKHNKENVSRLDIITPFSTVNSDDPQPKAVYVGMNTGSIYSFDMAFVNRVNNDSSLMDDVSDLWSPYIRVDDTAVTYIYSGPETDLSAMIRHHGSYGALIRHIMNVLTRIADKA